MPRHMRTDKGCGILVHVLCMLRERRDIRRSTILVGISRWDIDMDGHLRIYRCSIEMDAGAMRMRGLDFLFTVFIFHMVRYIARPVKSANCRMCNGSRMMFG